ncbi:hypothetical protein [Massilioclostridium coli]|uniref:hypothetical protein n=1 Tax=Massilioclostridium coli TaxID=1870991 RepID=UPI00085CD9B2|nr:hypothetical protein [Massilioclostridium coli]
MVKRWAVVGLIGIIVVFLVGCIGRTVNQVTTPLKTDFSLKTTMSYQDWETEGILSKTGGTYHIMLTSPESVDGMEFIYDGDKVTVSYLGLSVDVTKDSTLLNSVSSGMIQAVNHALLGADTTIKEKGEQYVIQGNTENGEYKLVVEQKTGLPVSLELKAMDLQCTFEPIEDTTSQSLFLSSVA